MIGDLDEGEGEVEEEEIEGRDDELDNTERDEEEGDSETTQVIDGMQEAKVFWDEDWDNISNLK